VVREGAQTSNIAILEDWNFDLRYRNDSLRW